MEERENMVSAWEENLQIRPEGKKKHHWGPVLVVLALIFAGLGGLFYVNEFALNVELAGDQEYHLEYGDTYAEPGMKAVLSGKWLLRSGYIPENVAWTIQSDLQEDKLGKYSITYKASLFGWHAEAERTVRVVDTKAPVLTLRTSGKTVLPGEKYVEEGYIAVDNHDGNLTYKVNRRVGLDSVIYTVMDSSGNPVSVERKIPYFDPLPPEIELTKGEYVVIPCGTFYSEPGFTASDNADGDLTEMVAVEGEVIWYQPGTYEIVYTIADAFGNVTQKIRTVEVQGQEWPQTVIPNGKTIYLTFDDGPSEYTLKLLDLLKRYGVKATFFVTGSGSGGELWRMYKEGHSIGMHTMTHDYQSIYASEEAFFNDLYSIQDVIYRNTGIRPTLMRFPGGGSNLVSSFNEGIMTRLTKAVQDAGFQYFDWNVDSNDAGGALRRQTVATNVIENVKKQRTSVVLQHDIHGYSVDAVEDIIIWGLENGYRFLPLTETSPAMHHAVLN